MYRMGIPGAMALTALFSAAVSAAEPNGEPKDEAKPDPRVRPGAKFILNFDKLGPMWAEGAGKEPTKVEVCVPTDYDPKKKVPLLAWFAGGYGTYRVWQPLRITGGKTYVIAALPYSGDDGTGKGGWSHSPWPTYYKPMIDEIEKIVPNIDADKRIVGGFSSGGTAVAHHIGHSGAAFRDYFFGFIAGGAGWSMGGLDAIRGRPMLVYIGDKDSRFSNLKSLYSRAKGAKVDAEFLVFKNTGHEIPEQYYPELLEWMERKVLYRDLPPKIEAAKMLMRARRFEKAVELLRQLRKDAEGTLLAARVEELVQMLNAVPAKELDDINSRTKRLSVKARVERLKKFVAKWEGLPAAEEAGKILAELGADRTEEKPAESRKRSTSTGRTTTRSTADPEAQAASKLRMALNYKANGMHDAARRLLDAVVEEYPDTEAAKEALKQLRTLRN